MWVSRGERDLLRVLNTYSALHWKRSLSPSVPFCGRKAAFKKFRPGPGLIAMNRLGAAVYGLGWCVWLGAGVTWCWCMLFVIRACVYDLGCVRLLYVWIALACMTRAGVYDLNWCVWVGLMVRLILTFSCSKTELSNTTRSRVDIWHRICFVLWIYFPLVWVSFFFCFFLSFFLLFFPSFSRGGGGGRGGCRGWRGWTCWYV